jgi:DNA replication and repair protein RecF
MGFNSLKPYQFRNLVNAEVRFSAPRIFLVGENGQGKSNLLEAVYLLSFGSSFRTRRDQELILRGEQEMALHGTTTDRSIALAITSKSGTGKQIRLDGNPVKDRKELVSLFPAIIFCHDDITFAKGSPDRKRWFFDQTMSLHDPLFIDSLRSYRKLLRMRNIALREGASDLLDVYDRQMASSGLFIQKKRKEAVFDMNKLFTTIFGYVSAMDGEMLIDYRPAWRALEDEEEVCRFLKKRRESDIEMGTSTSGPHRDRFVFLHQGKDFSTIASTGQLRLLSLLLRVGQARFYHEKSGKKPILLLDDVLLELDPARRERFLETLPEADQSFFTFLPDRQYLSLMDGETELFKVKNGEFFLES